MLDVVGFSTRMGRDDVGTTERVVALHGEVAALAGTHGGRVVHTAGDSVFAEFESIVAALECAVAIQQRIAKDESEDRLMVRIGLHFGDVLVHDDDLFGDGINLAARLEALAPPGGIAVSEVVVQEVGSRIDFEDWGTHALKNIARPVRVFVVPPSALGFPDSDTGQAEESGVPVEAAAAVEEVAALIRERVAAKRAYVGEPGDAPRIRRRPRGVSGVLGSGGFWMRLVLGGLMLAAVPSGWTTNGLYTLAGAVLVSGAAGDLAGAAVRRRGVGALTSAVGLALGALALDGTVGRAIVWAAAAATGGPALVAVLRRSDPS